MSWPKIEVEVHLDIDYVFVSSCVFLLFFVCLFFNSFSSNIYDIFRLMNKNTIVVVRKCIKLLILSQLGTLFSFGEVVCNPQSIFSLYSLTYLNVMNLWHCQTISYYSNYLLNKHISAVVPIQCWCFERKQCMLTKWSIMTTTNTSYLDTMPM